MKHLATLLIATCCFTAFAQGDIDYPYNPDFENDGFVGIEDVLELLSVYGTPFTPEQLLLDGASLTEIIESLQSHIDSLASYTTEGFNAIAINDSLLTEYLVGVAAASEEGDSTLGAWVLQLSEVVQQQQTLIDSLHVLTQNQTAFLFENDSLMEAEINALTEQLEDSSALNGTSGLLHGHFDIASGDSLLWVVPDGVNLLEVTLSGSNGGQGQGTNYCTWAYGGSAVSGCGGAAGGQGLLLVQVTQGDTVAIYAGATPPPPTPNGGSGEGHAGAIGNPSQLLVNNTLIATATGGGGGKGYYCQGGSFYSQCAWIPQPEPSPGEFIGPTIDSGAFLLDSGTGGGGNCVLRY